MRFEGKTALVTGGTTGIGYSTAERLLADGAKSVLITGQNPDRVREAAASLGNRAAGLVVDQRKQADIAKLAETLRADPGGLDIVFLNAGVALMAPTEGQDEAQFDEQIAVNVKGTFFVMKALLPLLRSGASVIVNTSVVSHLGPAGMAAYAATKAAVRSMVRTWAAEFKDRGIRVNAVAPGPIETPIFGKLGLDQATMEGMGAQMKAMVPMGRFGSAAEISGAVAFLASADASYMTGEELTLAGGMGAF